MTLGIVQARIIGAMVIVCNDIYSVIESHKKYQ